MSQDQRRRADEWLERIAASLRSPHLNGYALKHIHTLLVQIVPALFPVADDLAEDPMHPTGRCTCGGGGACEWCLDTELRAQNIPEGHPTTLGFYLVSHAGDHAPSNIYIAELSHCPSIGTLEWWQVATEHSETPAQFYPGKVLALLHSREGGVCGDNRCRLCSTDEPVTAEKPCNCPQALDAEHRVARLYDALAIAMAHVERLKSAEDDRYQAEQTLVTVRAEANASEERADHLDRGHEVLAEELAAAHTLTAHLERRVKSETARANNERDLANTAELCLARVRAEWTSTRADLEAENERLHERLRLLQRTCPGPSPAAQVMIEEVADLRAAEPLSPEQHEQAKANLGAMIDAELGPVAVLDDPRMDGVSWTAATDVSVEMLHAWPFWERWTADSTDVLPCHQVDFGPGANTTHKLRPLRLPGMDASGDGVVATLDTPTVNEPTE